jgi:hypothetical protein
MAYFDDQSIHMENQINLIEATILLCLTFGFDSFGHVRDQGVGETSTPYKSWS